MNENAPTLDPAGLAAALANVGRFQRSCIAVAAAAVRDASTDDPAWAAVFQAIAVTAAEMSDEEDAVLARADMPLRAELLGDGREDD